MKSLFVAMGVAGLVGAAAPAFADDNDLSPARMQRLDDRAASQGFTITHGKAIEIAKSHGVVTIREVDLEDNAEWKIEGRDADGREIEVELSARDGTVREIDRD